MRNNVTVSGRNNGLDGQDGGHEYKVPSLPSAQQQNLDKATGLLVNPSLAPAPDLTQDDFTPEEWEDVKQLFKDFDIDRNGCIEIEEFVSLCETVGLSRERALRISVLYDEDGDGVIDFAEFAKRDVVGDLEDAVCEMQQPAEEDLDGNTTQGEMEYNTHVNVAKILQVVRAKIDNSRIAFAFGRYMCFVTIYVFVTMYQRNPRDSMQLTAGLTNYFVESQYRTRDGQMLKGFKDLVTIEDVWDWHELHFVERFFQERYYNDALRNQIDQNTILEHNKLTGGYRMTQRRIKNNTCNENLRFKPFAPNCFGELYVDGRFPDSDVEKEPFYGIKSGAAYVWEDRWFWDQGYYEEFAGTKQEAKDKLTRLRGDMWLGPATQYFRLDFAVYNPNVGLFAFVKFTLDMRPTGKIIPSFQVTTRRAGYYLAGEDWIRLACEIIVVIAWCMYMYGEFLDARRLYRQQGRLLAYFSEFWNAVDILHLIVVLMLIITWIIIITDATINNVVVTEAQMTMPNGQPLDFTESALAVRFYFALHGLNMLIIVVRILKFLRQNAFLGQLTDAFELMRPGLLQFAVVLFIVIFLFTAIGVILFGSKIKEFSEFLDAIDMIMGYTVGYSDPMDLFNVEPVSSIFFYYPFTFLMAFFVLPLTIAVIMDGYGEMQAMYEAARTTNLQDVIELSYISQLYRGGIRSLQWFIPNHHKHPRLKLPSKKEVLRLFADLNKYEVISFAELRKMFRDKYISEELLVLVIKKYNAFQPDPEWHHLVDDRALEKRNLDEEDEASELAPLIEQLQLRADQIVRDQQAMQRKLDLLCEIFPPAAPVLDEEEDDREDQLGPMIEGGGVSGGPY